jgi:hypothetical protein
MIFHTLLLKDGEQPNPFTQITLKEVEEGKWTIEVSKRNKRIFEKFGSTRRVSFYLNNPLFDCLKPLDETLSKL